MTTKLPSSAVPYKPLPKVAMRVFGGIENPPHLWPSAVRMRMPITGSRLCGYTHFCGQCGGTIINKEWILTAGHCCVTERNVERSPNEISFAVGAHYDNTCDYSALCGAEYNGAYRDVTGDIVNAVMLKVHPQYKSGRKTIAWDACLVKVDQMDLDGIQIDKTYLPGNSFKYVKNEFFLSY